MTTICLWLERRDYPLQRVIARSVNVGEKRYWEGCKAVGTVGNDEIVLACRVLAGKCMLLSSQHASWYILVFIGVTLLRSLRLPTRDLYQW